MASSSDVVAIAADTSSAAADTATSRKDTVTKEAKATPPPKISYKYPKGRRGEIASAFFDAFNSQMDSLLMDFHHAYQAPDTASTETIEDRVWENLQYGRVLGTLIPSKTVKLRKTQMVFLAKSEKIGTWFHVSFELDTANPQKLIEYHILPAPRPK